MKTLPLLITFLLFAGVAPAADEPETVAVTVKAKPGNESKLESALKKHWTTIKRLDLVTNDPHLLLRGDDGLFINIFTWKSGSIPDNAPAEVLAVWKEMNEASTKLEIVEVKRVPLE
jgi:hypothetical protein